MHKLGFRSALFLAVLLGLLMAAQPAFAQTPSQQLEVVARRVDAALTRLDAGDLSGARAEYQGFSDRWFDIEDGVRALSRDSYRAIEDAMGDAKYALNLDPFDIDKARAALQQLRAVCDVFIAGPSSNPDRTPSDGSITLPKEVDRLDRAVSLLDGGNVTGAAAEVATFRKSWIEVEGLVKVKSSAAYANTENNMAKAAALLSQQTPDIPGARATLVQMKHDLAPFAVGDVSYGASDAAIILLREGLEALLVVAALIAFLKKTRNGEKGRWVWGGSVIGLLASVVVAVIVNLAFAQAAGSNRELLEGITGLVAAVMLVYMSFWLHSKSSLGAWQRYINEKTSGALARNSVLSLALIAFLAVFREGAETVLFYLGIAPSISAGSLALGIGIGTGGLIAVAIAILLFGVRIPIRPFFLATSALVYYLAFKFVGTGIHSLQVAGKLRATPADYLPSNDILGLFPTWETTIVQGGLLAAGLAVLIVSWLRRPPARSEHHKPAPEAG